MMVTRMMRKKSNEGKHDDNIDYKVDGKGDDNLKHGDEGIT